MSLLQEEREIILGNEYVDNFDFAEVEEFVKNASKDLFISHHIRYRRPRHVCHLLVHTLIHAQPHHT